jgi:RND family efflux transporter MFP subunit
MSKKTLTARVALTLLAGCGGDDGRPTTMPTRPVSVIELTERNYGRERELTGVVRLYREEDIGFEVGGRVTTVLDEGLEVRGPAFNEKGELVRKGDPIAAMEGTRYGSEVGALQAQLEAAERDLQAVEAQLTLTTQVLERKRKLVSESAGSQQALDDARSAFDQATAQLAARRAAIRAAGERLARATEDLGDSVLYAPFSGRVTAVHIAEGAVVDAGQPILTLTLMDPVRVQIEVSADHERELRTGDRALILPKDPFDSDHKIPVNGIVFEKSAVADPRLRTFRIDLIARNLRRHVEDRNPELKGRPTASDGYLPVIREFQGEAGPLFVSTRAILIEDDKTYVMRLPGVSFHDGADRSAVGLHIPERVDVELGDEYSTVVNWNFRSIEDSGTLIEGDFLILNPHPDYAQGVLVGRPQWLLRPGDLVPVRFDLSRTTTGFYAPGKAITLLGGELNVFRVEAGIARATRITLHETAEEQRRIEGEGLSPGTQLVVGGVHYISEGQPVSVTEVLK